MERKMSKKLLEWKNDTEKTPLILYGARQVGKTYTILSFGKENYKNVAYINFEDNTEISKKRAGLLQERLNDSCEKILSENINIYSTENYHEKNAWALYHYCKDRNEKSRFTAYIAKCLSPLTAYKIVWDITTEAIGRDHRYSINDENLNAFCADTALLENVINTTEPRNNDEQFVKKVFEASIYGKEDVWGHKGVSVSHHKRLKL